jgi:hypothetical protein
MTPLSIGRTLGRHALSRSALPARSSGSISTCRSSAGKSAAGYRDGPVYAAGPMRGHWRSRLRDMASDLRSPNGI